MVNPLVLLAAIVSPPAGVEPLQTVCTPIAAGATILASPHPADVDPRWKAPNFVGLDWTLRTTQMIHDEAGTFYLVGDLISPRGGVVTRHAVVIARQWDCG